MKCADCGAGCAGFTLPPGNGSGQIRLQCEACAEKTGRDIAAHVVANLRGHGAPVTWDKRAADTLADEVAALVRRGVIDSRSPAADALLDYRDPPSTPRADRLAALEADRDRAAVDARTYLQLAADEKARAEKAEAELEAGRVDREADKLTLRALAEEVAALRADIAALRADNADLLAHADADGLMLAAVGIERDAERVRAEKAEADLGRIREALGRANAMANEDERRADRYEDERNDAEDIANAALAAGLAECEQLRAALDDLAGKLRELAAWALVTLGCPTVQIASNTYGTMGHKEATR